MLVLTRKPNETIRIADDIYVTVISIEGNKVRLGFQAPRDVDITRTELLDEEGQFHPAPAPAKY